MLHKFCVFNNIYKKTKLYTQRKLLNPLFYSKLLKIKIINLFVCYFRKLIFIYLNILILKTSYQYYDWIFLKYIYDYKYPFISDLLLSKDTLNAYSYKDNF